MGELLDRLLPLLLRARPRCRGLGPAFSWSRGLYPSTRRSRPSARRPFMRPVLRPGAGTANAALGGRRNRGRLPLPAKIEPSVDVVPDFGACQTSHGPEGPKDADSHHELSEHDGGAMLHAVGLDELADCSWIWHSVAVRRRAQNAWTSRPSDPTAKTGKGHQDHTATAWILYIGAT